MQRLSNNSHYFLVIFNKRRTENSLEIFFAIICTLCQHFIFYSLTVILFLLKFTQNTQAILQYS